MILFLSGRSPIDYHFKSPDLYLNRGPFQNTLGIRMRYFHTTSPASLPLTFLPAEPSLNGIPFGLPFSLPFPILPNIPETSGVPAFPVSLSHCSRFRRRSHAQVFRTYSIPRYFVKHFFKIFLNFFKNIFFYPVPAFFSANVPYSSPPDSR